MTYVLVAFLVVAASWGGFFMGRSGIRIIEKEPTVSTFKSNILESYQTWDEDESRA